MKITMKTELLVLAKCEPKLSKDGQTTYYKLSVMQGEEVGQVNCPESVYVSVSTGKPEVFNVEYNSEYKSLRLLGIAASPTVGEPSPAGRTAAPAEGAQSGGTKK